MHYQIYQNKLNQLTNERNNALLVIVGLFLICFILVGIIYHMVDENKTNFTPLPPVMTAPFSLSRSEVSSGYLADMSRYFAMLRLNYTPASLPSQMQLLLQYTDGRFFGEFKQQLAQEQLNAKAHDLSLTFMPIDTYVVTKSLSVLIDGDLIRSVGKVQLPRERVSYRITYVYQNGVLKVTAFLPVKKEEIPHV